MPLDVSRIKGLCFDVDGTLNDTDDQWVQRFGRILRPVRALLPGRDENRFARECLMAAETPANFFYRLADDLHLDDDLLKILNRRSSHSLRRSTGYLIIPGILETLERLSKLYPMAVVSARDERTTLAFLDQYGLTGRFVCVVTSQTCEYTKPYPHPVLFAAQQMGLPPENCLMIGDTTVDIKAGRRAGGQTAGVLCGFGREKELRVAGADVILQTTCHIEQVLLS